MSQNDAVKAVKDRFRAIMKSDEATGREALAEHLAFETEMSAEDVIAALMAAPCGLTASSTQQEQEYQPPRRMMNAQDLNRESWGGGQQAGKGKLAANMKRRNGIE